MQEEVIKYSALLEEDMEVDMKYGSYVSLSDYRELERQNEIISAQLDLLKHMEERYKERSKLAKRYLVADRISIRARHMTTDEAFKLADEFLEIRDKLEQEERERNNVEPPK